MFVIDGLYVIPGIQNLQTHRYVDANLIWLRIGFK